MLKNKGYFYFLFDLSNKHFLFLYALYIKLKMSEVLDSFLQKCYYCPQAHLGINKKTGKLERRIEIKNVLGGKRKNGSVVEHVWKTPLCCFQGI